MSEQIKDDAWLLGYEWAMGEFDLQDKQYIYLQTMPEFNEGVQIAEDELKKDELKKLVLGD